VNYLVQLEMPINKSYELEEGIDLLFVINEYGRFLNAYPLSKMEEIINHE